MPAKNLERKGRETSEFWLAIAGACIPILDKIFGLELPKEAIYTIIAYIVARSGAKAVIARRK